MPEIFHDTEAILFWIIGGLTAGSALMTLLSQNIVRSATWLLFTLGGTSGVFFLLGADFVGATQLLVYVGGTLILVVFGVMLTAQGPFITMKASAAEWAISFTVGVALYVALAIAAVNTAKSFDPVDQYKAQLADIGGRLQKLEAEGDRPKLEKQRLDLQVQQLEIKEKLKQAQAEKKPEPQNNPATAKYTNIIGLGFLGQGVGPAHQEDGKTVRTSYLLPFEIVSVHLLVVLIGAAYLARAKRRKAS